MQTYTHLEEGFLTKETVVSMKTPLQRRLQRFVASLSYQGKARYDSVIFEHCKVYLYGEAEPYMHVYVAKLLMLYHQSQ